MTTQEAIKELEIDIQYLQSILVSGWEKTQEYKNEVSAELEQLKQKVTNLKNKTSGCKNSN